MSNISASIVGKINDLLSKKERGNILVLSGVILAMALLEMLGVASIMPFMAVLANPELIMTSPIFSTLYTAAGSIGYININQFLFCLGVLVFALILFSLVFKAAGTYMQLRFVLNCECAISKRLIKKYLDQPYAWFFDRNSAELGMTILSEVHQIIFQIMQPMMTIIAQSAAVMALLALLLFVDIKLALTVGFVLGMAYGLIAKLVSGFLLRSGHAHKQANQKRFGTTNEAFSAIKEIKVFGLEETYLSRFSIPAQIYANNQATSLIVGQLPRFLLEGIAFGGMILLLLILMAREGGFASAVPIVALYAFAGYRLMPALQQIYASFSQIRFAEPTLNSLHSNFMALQSKKELGNEVELKKLRHLIELDRIEYKYPNSEQLSLKGISISIPAGSSIGLVGATGSGKTTIVDLILGLLIPDAGSLMVDGQVITNKNRRSWQKKIGYVSQSIYLSDNSIAENIAFGEDVSDIDQSAVEIAARVACLHDFVLNELPNGYATLVGERGVRLSGGQRQRIGIARALYRNPNILILDEATSALDNLTEHDVIEAIHSFRRDMTTIYIAHRLGTVRECDQIYLIDSGEVKASGTYDELKRDVDEFQKMVSMQS